MLTLSLFARLEAKPGKEKDLAAFLMQGLQLAQAEAATPVWFCASPGADDLRHLRRVPRRGGPPGTPRRTDRPGADGQGR